MKKLFSVAVCAAVIGWAGVASASMYQFEDMIDDWNVHGVEMGAVPILQYHSSPFTYTHDINDSVNFGAGDKVVQAFLELDFTNDSSDKYGKFLFIPYDNREYVKVVYDGTEWIIGEANNGQYNVALDVYWLNDDGKLDVTIKVRNDLGTASAWLDHSRLYGTAESAPVPEPTTMLLFGTGLAGLAAVGRRRKATKA